MATADHTSDAFLSGEGIPVPLGRVEEELAKLWGPAAEREGGPDLDRPTVTRLVLANLVVADLESDGSRVRALVEGLSRHYPCRMIILRRSPEAGRSVQAEVSAICHLPAPGLPQVCAERIILRAGSEALDLLPGAVRPLLETDLPLVLWWAGDPRPVEALFRDLADESARLIVDQPDPQPDPGALRAALDLTVNRFSRDLAWFGVTPWRELLAAFFDPPDAAAALEHVTGAHIAAVAPTDAATPRVALWLAAWLAGRLGWEPGRRTSRGALLTSATFSHGRGTVDVSFTVRPDASLSLPHLTSVMLDAGAAGTYRVSRPGLSADVQAEAHVPAHAPLPRSMHVPEWDAERRLAGALESARDDPPYREALPHLLWLLGG